MRREMPIKAKSFTRAMPTAQSDESRRARQEKQRSRFNHQAIIHAPPRRNLSNGHRTQVGPAAKKNGSEKMVVLPEPKTAPANRGEGPRDAEASAPIKDR